MREIKFDVILWESGDKESIEHYTFEEAIGEDFIAFKDGAAIPQDDSIIIREYTGLKDKNGKEIYEGDIVTTGIFQDINGKQEECRFVVEWKGKYGMWGLANRNAITTFILSEVSMWEVIGNIYENPELLKERNSF